MNPIHRSIIFSALERYGRLALLFVSTAVLARLLTPSEFGIYAIVNAIVLLIIGPFQEFGGANYLIQRRSLSRKNILLRDRNTCQFCGRVFPGAELTLDHVLPRSRGGRSSWENLVACCYSCNNSKGDRTPEEAGLKLARRPRPFTLHTSRQLMRLIGHRDDRWRKYLFY